MSVIFMCGPAGSGKTYVARDFERRGFARLSFDTQAWERGIRTMPLSPETHEDIAAELREQLLALVAVGRDVVLDFSFWSRSMRQDYRELLKPLGVVPTVVYVRTPRAVALQRIGARNRSHGDDFTLEADVAAQYYDHFEAPTEQEGPLIIVDYDPHTGESRDL